MFRRNQTKVCIGGGKFTNPQKVDKAVWPFPISLIANMER